MASKYTLTAGDKEFELSEFQNPRGLRNGSKRPDRIKLDVKENLDRKGLLKHINYLVELSHAMELENSTREKPLTTQAFEELCEIRLNRGTDKFEFHYAGKLEHTDKSKFECLIAKKALQKELDV